MVPIRYQVVGEEDFSFEVRIERSGAFHVSSGTYTSDKPRSGQLSPEQEHDIIAAIQDLGIPVEHPRPEDSSGFQAHLVVGEGGESVDYPFWEGAIQEDAKLERLVRILESL